MEVEESNRINSVLDYLADTYSEDYAIFASLILGTIPNGSFWRILTKDEAEGIGLGELVDNTKEFRVFPLKGSYLIVHTNPQELLYHIEDAGGLFSTNVLNYIDTVYNNNIDALRAYLSDLPPGGVYNLYAYNTADSSNVVVGTNIYSSFTLPIPTILEFLDEFGYKVFDMKDKMEIEPSKLIRKLKAFHSRLRPNPTATAVSLYIMTPTPETKDD